MRTKSESPQSRHGRRRKTAGVTLVELLVGSSISMLVLYGAVMLMVAGSASWYKGEGKIQAETQSQRAVRVISAELREAMSITVDANGLGLNYRLPQKDGNGNYVVPALWDNVTRRIELSGSNIRIVENGSPRTICRNVILTDPKSTTGEAPYVIFAAGAGAITRQLTVMVVTRTGTYKGGTTTSRSRETLFLRNIPELLRG